MKKFALILVTIGISTTSMADIQAPPGALHEPLRKFSRGLANILYGVTELPATIAHINRTEGSSAATYGVLYGAHKTAVRFGYGFYECVTCNKPKYKDSYRPGLPTQDQNGVLHGFTEFPPELGFEGHRQYCRSDSY